MFIYFLLTWPNIWVYVWHSNKIDVRIFHFSSNEVMVKKVSAEILYNSFHGLDDKFWVTRLETIDQSLLRGTVNSSMELHNPISNSVFFFDSILIHLILLITTSHYLRGSCWWNIPSQICATASLGRRARSVPASNAHGQREMDVMIPRNQRMPSSALKLGQ